MAQEQQKFHLDENGELVPDQPDEVAVTLKGEGGYLDEQGNLINAQLPDAAKLTDLSQPSAPMGGMLPTAGGMVGSLVGGAGGTLFGPAGALVGRSIGAGAGGALGKGAELLLDEKDDTIGDSLSQMGEAALWQGVPELAFGGLGKAASKFAPRLMQSVLKPSKAIANEYGDVASTAVQRAIPASQGGAKKVGRLIDTSVAKTEQKLQQAQHMGARPVDIRDAAQELNTVATNIGAAGRRTDKLDELSNIRQQYITENPTPMPLMRAQAMKRAEQKLANDAFRAAERGAPVNSVEAQGQRAMAIGLQKEIEKRANVAALNKGTQGLMGVDIALENALRRIGNNQPVGMNALIASGAASTGIGAGVASGSPETGLGVGGGLGLGILALTNPYLASRTAIGLHKAAPAIGQTMNIGRTAALLAALAEQGTEQ